jgi:hypothetical protein
MGTLEAAAVASFRRLKSLIVPKSLWGVHPIGVFREYIYVQAIYPQGPRLRSCRTIRDLPVLTKKEKYE